MMTKVTAAVQAEALPQQLDPEFASGFRQVGVSTGVPLWQRWAQKGLAAILDQATLSLTGFIITIELARTVTPAAYGAFSLAYSAFILISGLHNSLLLEPMSVLGPASYARRLDWYGQSVQRMNAGLSMPIACIIAGVGLVSFLTSAGRDVGAALMAMACELPFALLLGVVRRSCYIRGDPRGAWVTTTIYFLAVIAGLVLLRATATLSPGSAFLLIGLASAVAILMRIPKQNTALSPFWPTWPDRTLTRQHWKYGRWILAASIVYWLSTEAYNSFTAFFLGLEDAGALRALQNLISPAVQLVAAVSTLLLPWAAGRVSAGDSARVHRTLSRVSLLLLGATVAYAGVLSWFRVPLIRLLYQGKYLDHAWLLPWLALVPVVVALASGPQVLTRALQRPHAILVAYAASSCVACSAGLYLMARWGLLGSVLGYLTSFIIYLLVLCCYARTDARHS